MARELKRYEDWQGDLHQFLEVGDLVDEGIQNHFINELPPACWNANIIQMGEAYSSDVDGKPTFETLKRVPEGWAYAGHCKIGQTVVARDRNG